MSRLVSFPWVLATLFLRLFSIESFSLPSPYTSVAFPSPQSRRSRPTFPQNGVVPRMTSVENPSEEESSSDVPPLTSSCEVSRRKVLSQTVVTVTRGAAAAAVATSGCCCCCPPDPAYALAQLQTPPAEALKRYDLPRNALKDAAFAQGMAIGMGDYERAAFPTKQRLFQTLLVSLDSVKEPTVVEIGIGSFPNAPYYQSRLTKQGGVDLVGIDPNDRMEGYARNNARRFGLEDNANNSLRIVHGVSEALPLETNSCDAVVCSLTLCSVVDPERSVAEIRRVLKPGGKFLFWEHVLSETDIAFALEQIRATPAQVQRADGCHLDRRTGETLRNAGFAKLDIEYLELQDFGFLNPTVCGIATA